MLQIPKIAPPVGAAVNKDIFEETVPIGEPLQEPFSSSSVATYRAVDLEGFIGDQPTKILVDTGSSVSILWEVVLKEVANTQQQCESVSGSFCACYPVQVAKNITQECPDFPGKFGCIIDLQGQTLTTRMSVPLLFQKT